MKISLIETHLWKKLCPKCQGENDRKNVECEHCGYKFPKREGRFRKCESCEHKNPVHLEECESCGSKFGHEYTITLDSALRMGGIAREMDVDEGEVLNAEKYYKELRKQFLESGEARIIESMSLIPEEAWGKIGKIIGRVFNKEQK